MSVEFSAIKETPPTCIPKGYTSEASGPLLFRRSSSLFERAKKGFVLGCRDRGTLSNPCGEIDLWWNKLNKKYIYVCFDTRDRPRSKQGMVGASNFHLLGVGAEKSSLYRLGLLGFDAYLILMKRGRFYKGAFKPFCWIVGLQPRPIE